jgi:LTXXQ motif family protein
MWCGAVFTTLAVAVAVGCTSTATEARRHRSSLYFEQPAAERADGVQIWQSARRNQKMIRYDHAAGISAVVRQLMFDCEREVMELKSFPVESISLIISPNEVQSQSLADISKLSAETGDKLAKSCPAGIPASLNSRLEGLEQELHAVQLAVDELEPALQMLYDLLSDEQKARLVAQSVLGRSNYRASDPSWSRRRHSMAPPDAPRFGARPKLWDCAEWQGRLRWWPVWQVEVEMRIAPRQRAPLYEFVAVMQRAADALADACPQKTMMTPVAAADEAKRRIEALLQSIALIRPALGRFDSVLDAGQRAKLTDLM